MKKIISFVFAVLALNACKKTDPGPTSVNNNSTTSYTNGVIVLDEGGFFAGNATVSFVERAGQSYYDIFAAANNRPLGDVAQSMIQFGGKVYIIVNNSQKIEVADPSTMTTSATISGFTSPRFMAFSNSTKAYVTELYGDVIRIVNPSTNTISGSIPTSGWTERAMMVGSELFVTQMDTGLVYVISTSTDQITDSIDVANFPGGMVLDNNNKLWVLAGGEGAETPALYRIDPSSRSIEQTFNFSGGYPGSLAINSSGNKIYYLNNGVYEMDVNAGSLPSSPLIPANGRSFYNIGIDPVTGNICVTDAVDYVSRGFLFRFNSAGAKIDSVKVGVNPSSLLFVD